jgi:hypothetical protein
VQKSPALTCRADLVILVVVPVDWCLRDFATAPGLIPLFSRPCSLLPMELAQFWAHFQIAFRFRCDYFEELASPAFVSHSAFVHRLARKGSE